MKMIFIVLASVLSILIARSDDVTTVDTEISTTALSIKSAKVGEAKDSIDKILLIARTIPGDTSRQDLKNRKLKQYIAILNILNKRIDPKFDPNNFPSINVPPPLGYDSGTSPDAISDPKLKQQYQAAIDQNEVRSKIYSEQAELASARTRILNLLKVYIVNNYSIHDISEVQGYLQDVPITDTERKKLLAILKT